jgi:hypothetical protein
VPYARVTGGLAQRGVEPAAVQVPARAGLRTPAGIADLHLTGPDGTEIIEAKRSSDHRFVREALAQLLDYAPHSPLPADRLATLLPVRPADADIALLHRYGIDCLFRTTPGAFQRSPAPAAAREYMQKRWNAL